MDQITERAGGRKPVERGEFAGTAMRHRCRNPKCRMKLPKPVGNEREAFCCRGCHSSFYRHHCRVCEEPIEQKAGRQRVICKKAACRNAWEAKSGFGRYADPGHGPSCREMTQEVSVNGPLLSGSKVVDPADRFWSQTAGPTLPPNRFHAAIIPDGPGGQWKGGEYQRVTIKNNKLLQEATQAEIAANGEFTDPDWREVISSDGVVSFVVTFPIAKKPIPTKWIAGPLPEDLSIPPFLKREAWP